MKIGDCPPLSKTKILKFLPIMIVGCMISSCDQQTPIVSYSQFLKELNGTEVRYIDVLFMNWNTDYEVPETIEHLRQMYQYKIRINRLYGTAKAIEESLKTLSLDCEVPFSDDNIRLGCIFYNHKGKEIYSLYFSSVKPEIIIDNKRYALSADIFESFIPFIPDYDRKSFVQSLNERFETNTQAPSTR